MTLNWHTLTKHFVQQKVLFGGNYYPAALCVASDTQQHCIIHDGTGLIAIHDNENYQTPPEQEGSVQDVIKLMGNDESCMFLDPDESTCLTVPSTWSDHDGNADTGLVCSSHTPASACGIWKTVVNDATKIPDSGKVLLFVPYHCNNCFLQELILSSTYWVSRRSVF